MAVGSGLVGVAVCAGPMVGVGVKVRVGFDTKVAVGDGRIVCGLIQIAVAEGKTSAGSAATTPVAKTNATATVTNNPMKKYLSSEGM